MAAGFSAINRSFAKVNLDIITRTYSSISVVLRPDDKDGLILRYGRSILDFLEIELSNGFVQFRYHLCSKTVTIRSSNKMSLYGWHAITAERRHQRGEPHNLDAKYQGRSRRTCRSGWSAFSRTTFHIFVLSLTQHSWQFSN